MNHQLSVSTRIGIMLAIAAVFAVGLILLSDRTDRAWRADATSIDAGQRIERSFTVTSGGKLFLRADEGDVTITGTDSETVDVLITADGPSNRLKQFNVAFEEGENSVTITQESRRKFFSGPWNQSLEVRFAIHVPKRFNIDLHTSGGNIELVEIQGSAVGKTSGGDVRLDRVSGTINAGTSGGDLSFRNSSGDLTLRTSGGDVTGESIEGVLDVETSGGNVNLRNVNARVRAFTSGGNISATLQDNQGVELTTSGGNITVAFPRSVAATIDASTVGGDVECEFPFSGRLKSGSFSGSINGGGKTVRAKTSGGDIRFQQSN
jgi:DUF4097 and DUF4098 domain-containing protein YvlB